MGGSKTSYEVYQPTPPQPASTSDSIQDWVKALPEIYAQQLAYAPKEAAQQVQLAQQYAGQLGQAYLDAQKAMYPEEYALKEELASQAKEGMANGMPEWMREQYRDTFSANLGTNAGSGIGANYMGTSMLQAENDYRNYYKNLALSVSGSQPVYNATSPTYSNYLGSFSPQVPMNYNASMYAPYAAASQPMALQYQKSPVSLGFFGQWG